MNLGKKSKFVLQEKNTEEKSKDIYNNLCAANGTQLFNV